MEAEPTAGTDADVQDDAAGVEEPSRRERLRTSLRNLALATVAVVVVGVVSGWLFARSAPATAAAAAISALVEDLPPPEDGATVVAVARCGRADAPQDPDLLVAARAAGVVVIRHRPGELERSPELADLAAAAAREGVLVAPDEELGEVAVEVSSPGRRMPLDAYDPGVVRSYLTAYATPRICD